MSGNTFGMDSFLTWLKTHTSWVVLGAFALSFVFYTAYQAILEGLRMKKFGTRAPRMISWAPLELDVLVKAMNHLKKDTFFEWAQELLRRPGHTVEFNILGRRIVMTDDQANLKTIFATNFSTWEKGHHMQAIWRIILGDSIFTTDAHAWMANKAQLRGHLARMRPDDLELTEIDFQQLKKHLIKKEPQNVYDLMDRYQLDVVTRVFFGYSSDSLPATTQTFREAMEVVFNLNTRRIFLGPFGPHVPMNLIVGKSLKILNDYIRTFVDRTLSMPHEKLKGIPEKDLNLVERLALENRDPKTVKDQLLAVLTAAKDPSSMTIGWAIYELARNPKIAQKLQAEIASVVGFDTPPTAAQLKEMKYLHCVMKETLRCYLSLGFNMRTAKEDTSLPAGGGVNGDEPVAVLKGTQCLFSVLSMQKRTDIWGPDAEEWRPERWENYTPDVWDFIPFNHGPRVCLGRVFGQQQVEYALVRIFQDFELVELATMERQKIKVELNTKMASPCMCTFHPRKQGSSVGELKA